MALGWALSRLPKHESLLRPKPMTMDTIDGLAGLLRERLEQLDQPRFAVEVSDIVAAALLVLDSETVECISARRGPAALTEMWRVAAIVVTAELRGEEVWRLAADSVMSSVSV